MIITSGACEGLRLAVSWLARDQKKIRSTIFLKQVLLPVYKYANYLVNVM